MSAVFGLSLPRWIRFGRGVAADAASAVAALGDRPLLVHGADRARADWLIQSLAAAGRPARTIACPREPDTVLIGAGVALGRAHAVDVVVGLGGGSVMDMAKALAGLIPVTGDVLDYLEVVGGGEALEARPLPFVALPTTAGTGAEATANAVIDVPAAQRKVSLRDPRLLADMALVDPALTDSAPRAVTLASGLDAITQVIEPYISGEANRFTDALCRAAIPLGLDALMRLMRVEDAAARDDMAWVSLSGGLALANARLGAVHGLAGPLGGACSLPHGVLAGALLPAVLRANRERVEGQPAARIDEIERWLAAALDCRAQDAIERFAGWARAEGLPGLAAAGIDRAALVAIAEAAGASSSMRGNPVVLPAARLVEAMEQAW